MGVFKKIFGGSSENNTPMSDQDKLSSQELPKVKRTIFDFFKLDINNIPNDSFVAGAVETNESGDIIKNFRKTLDYKECDIFDTVEVIAIGESCKNVIFKSFQPDKAKMDNLKKLIDDLYLIYGNDWEGNGKFTNKDSEAYRDTEFNSLFGRRWEEYPKNKYPVAIYRDDVELSMVVSGIGLE